MINPAHPRQPDQPAPDLASLQAWLQWVITDPRGVSEALENPNPQVAEIGPARFRLLDESRFISRYQAPQPDCLNQIESTSNHSNADRLAIYAEAYFSRLTDSLAEDYPSVKRLVGAEGFLQLTADYLKEHPSRFQSLAQVGNAFAEFLSRHEAGLALPYIADLAKLEWLLIEAFYAADAAPIDAVELENIPAEVWHRTSFEMHPSIGLMHASFAVDEFWRKEADEVRQQERWLLIFRNDKGATVTPIHSTEFLALKMAVGGSALGEICKAIEKSTNVFSPEGIQSLFAGWLKNGIITRLRY